MKYILKSILVGLICCGSMLLVWATEEEAKAAAQKVREQLKELGFQVRDTYLVGMLDNSESTVFSRTFYQDNEYVLVVSGCSRTKDIDLYVFDDDGHLIDQDSDAAPTAVNTFTANYTGTYYIKLVMYDATSDNVYWAFQYGYR